MNKLSPLLALLALASLRLHAQTWNGSASTNWNDAVNWTPASVPDGTSATAIFTPAGLASDGSSTELRMNGHRLLGAILIQAGTPYLTLNVDNSAGPASLTLAGAGVQNQSATRKTIWLGDTDFYNTNPVTLDFTGQATVTGDVGLVAIGAEKSISFHDHSSAGSAHFFAYTVDFHDDSTAGAADFTNSFGANVTFHDRSAVAAAKLNADYGTITFLDFTSAGALTMTRTYPWSGSATMEFRGHSHAGTSQLSVASLTFLDDASAGQARLSNSGAQVYSSHGAYTGNFANLWFRDRSRGGSALITNNSMATLHFTDDSFAENAEIQNTGTVVFSGRAQFREARLLAGSGSYLVNNAYEQPAIPVTTGGVYFTEQASGGLGRIEIQSANAWLDFSGLYALGGTTGRAALAGDPAAPAVMPDDRVAFSLGSVTNTSPGGTIYLGGSILAIGADHRDMTLGARITDVGGSYGSLAGAPLRGGGLQKFGLGRLTISNPDNNYAGPTNLFAGTLHLAGGAIANAIVGNSTQLTGTGTVRGSLLNEGTVAPGTATATGTLQVQGDFTQAPPGALQIKLAGGDAFDRLVVGGRSDFQGRVIISALNGYVPVGGITKFTFLSSAGGILENPFPRSLAIIHPFAQFVALETAVLVNNGIPSPTLPTAGSYTLQVHQLPYAGFAESPPAAVLAAALDSTATSLPEGLRSLYVRLNTMTSAASLSAALDALAPDRYATLAEHGHLAASSQQAARDRHLAALRGDSSRGFEFYFEAGHRSARFSAVGVLPEASSTISSGTAGGTWRNGAFSLGASLTQESGDLELDTLGSRADVDGLTTAVFIQYAPGGFFANAAAGFSGDDYELRRRVVYPGYEQTAAAAPRGHRTDLAVNFGYAFRAGAWTLSPQAGVLGSQWRLGDLLESGAAGANLTISHWTARSVRARAGFEAVRTGSGFSPRLAVSWLHETSDARSFEAAFAGAAGAPFTAPGRPADRNIVQASAGFDWQFGRRTVFHVTAAGAWGGNTRLNSDLSAGFRWTF